MACIVNDGDTVHGIQRTMVPLLRSTQGGLLPQLVSSTIRNAPIRNCNVVRYEQERLCYWIMIDRGYSRD